MTAFFSWQHAIRSRQRDNGSASSNLYLAAMPVGGEARRRSLGTTT